MQHFGGQVGIIRCGASGWFGDVLVAIRSRASVGIVATLLARTSRTTFVALFWYIVLIFFFFFLFSGEFIVFNALKFDQ